MWWWSQDRTCEITDAEVKMPSNLKKYFLNHKTLQRKKSMLNCHGTFIQPSTHFNEL